MYLKIQLPDSAVGAEQSELSCAVRLYQVQQARKGTSPVYTDIGDVCGNEFKTEVRVVQYRCILTYAARHRMTYMYMVRHRMTYMYMAPHRMTYMYMARYRIAFW
jgi:hypothetical protein